MWVYKRTEPGVYTVGFYDPSGKWWTDSDWNSKEDAANRCAYLNGSKLQSKKHNEWDEPTYNPNE